MHRNEKPLFETALLTGGNGNLGQLVADRLLDSGVRVVKFDVPPMEPESTRDDEVVVVGDIRDLEQLEAVILEHRPWYRVSLCVIVVGQFGG